MNIVAHNHQSRELLSSKISRFLEEFHVGRILQACNAYKVRSFSVKDVFQVAFENAFSSKSFFQKQRESSTSIPFAKDTFYRFMRRKTLIFRQSMSSLTHGSALRRQCCRLRILGNRNNRQDYLILVSTDVNLSEEEIIQTYGKRWNIEVFFKMCKSYLKLGKESRTMSYDAMTAHVSIVLAKYMLLSLEQRRKIDKRSIGELFYVSCDELQDLQYMDALIMVLKKLVSMITEKWLFLEKELNAMLDSFLENLPDLWHNCLNRCA